MCHLLYADDAALTLHCEEGLQCLVSKLAHACKESGFTISQKKMNILPQDIHSVPVITRLDNVDSFTYLGSTVLNILSLDVGISSRIAKAAAVMAKLNKLVWNNNHLTENTKRFVYRACVSCPHSCMAASPGQLLPAMRSDSTQTS